MPALGDDSAGPAAGVGRVWLAAARRENLCGMSVDRRPGSMLPEQVFEIICCPRCHGDLVQVTAEQLRCRACAAEYPVVDGIPVLLAGGEDEVSRTVSAFYERAWKQTAENRLVARVAHDDLSTLGQRYVRGTEARFCGELREGGGRRRFFLDAACGAFPRKPFGAGYTYHVCLDFTLEALFEARRALGDRAICVCGSLLRAPLRDGLADGILASHCIYHIDQALQGVAARELLRVLAPAGKLLMFYANPDNVHSRLLELRRLRPLKALLTWAKRRAPLPPLVTEQGPTIYCYLHSIDHMRRELSSGDPRVRVAVKPLCLFQYGERAPLLQKRGGLEVLAYLALWGLENLYADRPDLSYYLAYIVERRGLPAEV
jgi:uncharacterized protein YbaR (Trm112 family)